MKKFFKKLSSVSQETKIGLTIAVIAVLFFSVIGISQRWWRPVEPGTSSPINTSSIPAVTSSTPTTSSGGTSASNPTPSSNSPVVSPLDEVVGYPCAVDATVVRHFFELEDDATKQAASIVFYQGKYLASQGTDFAMEDNTKFTVYASLTGVVTSKVEDAKYGLTVTILSANNVKFVYSSLSVANVDVNDEITKGTIIGKAGEAVFGSDLNKNHLHLEVFKDDTAVNPEKWITKTLGEIRL